uniref:Uncharacterized protein n=1 Tax=Caenorhabditis japonica TaxID=281687 RepID=A0A8R1I9N1_CAEJA
MRSSDVARRLGNPYFTFRNVSASLQKYGTSFEKPKSERPRMINTRKFRGVIERIIDGLSLNKVAEELKIRRKTVQRIVKNKLKLKNYKLVQGQYLLDASKVRKLDQASKIVLPTSECTAYRT